MDESLQEPKIGTNSLAPIGAFLGVAAFAYLVVRWMRSEMEDGL